MATIKSEEEIKEDPDRTDQVLGPELDELEGETQQIKKAVGELSSRADILEEFLELEHSVEFHNFLTKRERLAEVMGFGNGKDDNKEINGKRSASSKELVELLRAAKKQRQSEPAKEEDGPINPANWPPFVARLGPLERNREGNLIRKPLKRCHRCYDESHEMRDCPYKYEESRTADVRAMIKDRYEKLKAVEAPDPFLSKNYKRFNYKIGVKRRSKMAEPEPTQ